jgi:outer membrane murein-binding lipoprotein Lpp
MNFKHARKFSKLAVITLAMFSVSLASGEEPLKIFILAGQSNTVGHARAHTIATLFPSSDSRDQELVQMVFDSESGISRKTLEDQLTLGKNIDELTGGISNDKIKKMADGPEKTALQAKVDKLKEAHESYKKKVSAACATSNRVYINSIADRNKKSGKLGIGYGADDSKIGPEYGFGLSIAEQVEGPILLIKTSWGGEVIKLQFPTTVAA